MKKAGRYDASGIPEAQLEPGSNEHVLKNRLGIKTSKEMDHAELRALEKAMVQFVGKYDERHCFTANDIREIHRCWLSDIYEWAGEYRQVNLSKGDFPFAAAARIPDLMEEYERNVLAKYTPCNFRDRPAIARALAESHVELALIHPFREGNGRAARAFSILMALQAGLPFLNFSAIAGEKKQEYFAAVQAGLERNYAPMERLFSEIIERSVSSS